MDERIVMLIGALAYLILIALLWFGSFASYKMFEEISKLLRKK